MIATRYLKQEIKYDGSQLCSHWIYKQSGVLGDALLSFCGGCEVSLKNLVDLVDKTQQAGIFSPKMLHFIGEFFTLDLELVVCYQRLLICIIKEVLERLGVKEKIIRKGDDLFIEKAGKLKKLTVSIATLSPVSCVMHSGINIISRGTPVPALGLEDLKLEPQKVAELVLEGFAAELALIKTARSKVKGVSGIF